MSEDPTIYEKRTVDLPGGAKLAENDGTVHISFPGSTLLWSTRMSSAQEWARKLIDGPRTANGQPQPAKCDGEIFKNGTAVTMLAGGTPQLIEAWVREVARQSGQRLDWHYAGGRAVVLALGDLEKVAEAVASLRIQFA